MKSFIITLLLSFGLFASTNHTAKITETLGSGGYTYMKVVEGKNTYWIAMTQRKVKVGDDISFSEQGWMKNFKSKTLNRTFDNILFASDTTAAVSSSKLQDIKPNILKSSYKKAGTITVAEIFQNRSKYAKKSITIRGKVTKVSTGIMKRNWVHIEDGSRFQNMDDIVFTSTNATPKEGDIVSATGTVIIDKDFGYGYFYPVIMEKSSFIK
ncbi:MAG: hypothetical protein QM497_10390 [Sulfurimonas sp.]